MAKKLSDIASPVLELELPDGSVRQLDLYELGEKVNAIDAVDKETGKADLPKFYDAVREAFGFPTAAAAATAEPPAFTLTRAQCQELHVDALEKLDALPANKRFFSLMQSLSSRASSLAK